MKSRKQQKRVPKEKKVSSKKPSKMPPNLNQSLPDPPKEFNVPLLPLVNSQEKVQPFKIASGTHFNIMTPGTYKLFGSPALRPTAAAETLVGSNGTKLEIAGSFIAKVSCHGRTFELPFLVSTSDGARNLLGRQGIQILRLNWNKIFKGDPNGPTFQEDDSTPLSYFLEQGTTSDLLITVLINCIIVKMVFDSSASRSRINPEEYNYCYGIKPVLNTEVGHILIKDAANQKLELKGEFLAATRFPSICYGYCKQSHYLKLLVTKKNYEKNIFGTDWFHQLDELDFNQIFSFIR